MANPVRRVEVWEGETIRFRDRLYMNSGSAMTSSNAQSAVVRVFDLSATADESDYLYTSTVTSTSMGSLVVALTSWDVDDTGYNVSLTLHTSTFTQQGGHVYGVEIAFSTSTDGTKRVMGEVRVLPVGSV